MKNHLLSLSVFVILGFVATTGFGSSNLPRSSENVKATSGGEMTFTVRTVEAGGNYAPKHVLAIWVEDEDGFIKTRKAMANQRKQYLYTWKAASNYNVVDAITGPTLTSHQTHTISWDFVDLDGNLVPDGEYTVWAEFTDKHAQGPVYTLTFEKGPDPISLTPADETYFKDIEFDFTPYVAEFSMDLTEICQMETITFTDESVNATSWEWNFGEGAAPATASTQGPHTVFYTTPGIKSVSLTINGSVTELKEDIIEVTAEPEADFEYSGNDFIVNFSNLSTNAETYMWDFGDGNTSNEENPLHIYAGAGEYTVTLTAYNMNCEDEQSYQVSVPMVSILETSSADLQIAPNPSNGKFQVSIENQTFSKGTILIYNSQGTQLYSLPIDLTGNTPYFTVDISKHPKGMYFLSMKNNEKSYSSKVLIK